MDAHIPHNRMHILNVVNRALHAAFDDEVVSIQHVSRHGYVLRVRVGQERGKPRYFRIQISEER